MAREQPSLTRRTTLKQLGSVGIATFGATGAATGTQTDVDEIVSVGRARKIADQKRQQLTTRDEFAEWMTASLGTPETFYIPVNQTGDSKYQPSAYVFPVTKGTDTLGYITASARGEWTPVLAYSRSKPPQDRVDFAKSKVKRVQENPTGKLLYLGGLSYHLELTGRKATGLLDYQVRTVPATLDPTRFQMSDSQSSNPVKTSDVTTSSLPESIVISSVPGYDEYYLNDPDRGSDVKGDTSCSNCYGQTDDPWDDYDGCAPYAGANVVGNYESVGTGEWEERNELIDRMHVNMDTGSNIYTDLNDIAPGIEAYSNGQHTYSANTKSFSRDELKREIYYGRPALLTMWDGGSPLEDGYETDGYGNHTAAAAGYDDNGNLYWAIHDSYEQKKHWIANGNWDDADVTYVQKQ